MTRIVEISTIIILILLALSVIMMPWPANLIIGGVALVCLGLTLIYARREKQNKEQTDKYDR